MVVPPIYRVMRCRNGRTRGLGVSGQGEGCVAGVQRHPRLAVLPQRRQGVRGGDRLLRQHGAAQGTSPGQFTPKKPTKMLILLGFDT